MSVSIIIPTLNEATQIGAAIDSARAAGPLEIIVADGGSSDGTVELAQSADRVIVSPRGRAAQQNAGAALARSDTLLFLHADCRLPRECLSEITRVLASPHVAGGCFRQQIDAPGARYRWLERGNALRVKLWGLAYCDQAIFVRRETFERLGGFPPLALMEDLFFMKRLRREGKIAMLDSRLVVSPRRWQQQGVVRQTARNWFLTALAQCGVSPDRLVRLYPHIR
jgi:rSAM/selenodomain-associated transferase 2